MNVQPVMLVGRVIRLEPMDRAHISDLCQVGLDEEIWRYMRYGLIKEKAQMAAWVESLLAAQARGTDLPFTVVLQQDGRAIGATRYLEIRPAHRALEIGGTWYGRQYQRTAVNTEAKYLLLRHAFEVLGCLRVQLKADARNERSMHAIERLGAQREGVLRSHMLLENGVRRDSVYYSILDHEWPQVKSRLESMLSR